jgi:hypothetical protein
VQHLLDAVRLYAAAGAAEDALGALTAAEALLGERFRASESHELLTALLSEVRRLQAHLGGQAAGKPQEKGEIASRKGEGETGEEEGGREREGGGGVSRSGGGRAVEKEADVAAVCSEMQQACETAVSMLRAAEAHEAPQLFRAIAMQVLQVLRYVGEMPAPQGTVARALVLDGGLNCLQQVPVDQRTGAMCELDFWEGRLLAETPARMIVAFISENLGACSIEYIVSNTRALVSVCLILGPLDSYA